MQNNDHLGMLLNLLGKGKNAPPETAGKEELNSFIMNSLSESQSQMLKNFIENPAAAKEFMNSPQAKEILKKIDKK